MPQIEVNGAYLEYTESGSGPPVIFVHGSVNDYRTWEEQVRFFCNRYRVITYSRRYHHPNVWTGDGSDYSVSVHADDLIGVIEGLGLAPAHVVGSSYGAYSALVAALERPHLTRSLVLGEPPILPLLVSDPSKPRNLLALLLRDPRSALAILRIGLGTIQPTQNALRRGDFDEAVRRFINGMLGKHAYEKLPPFGKAMIRDNAEALKAELLASNFEPFPKHKARAFDKPVLFVSGEQTVKLYRRISHLLVNLLPKAEEIVIPDASHGMHRDNPKSYNEKILNFLSSQT